MSMKIWITGSGGMVGQNIIEAFDANTHEILSSSRSECDLSDFNAVRAYIQKHNPNLIIHTAGKVGGIQANMKDLYGFLLENMQMGMNVIHAADQCGVKNVINLGSSCMYPKDISGPLSEDMMLNAPLEPTNEGYAIAKISVAYLCKFLSAQKDNRNYKTIIPCNLYGRWDKFSPENSHMIPSVIDKIYQAGNKKVVIWGDGSARREFMYAGDLADFIVKAVERFDTLPPFLNVGLGYDYTIKEYYEAIAEVIGYKGDFEYDLTKPQGMKRKLLNIDKQKAWGWIAPNSFVGGIKKTVNFYETNYLKNK